MVDSSSSNHQNIFEEDCDIKVKIENLSDNIVTINTVLNNSKVFEHCEEKKVDDNFTGFKKRSYPFSISKNLKAQKHCWKDKLSTPEDLNKYGETASSAEALDVSQLHQTTKIRKRRMDRSINNNGPVSIPISASDFALHNNNNHVKNERLSPGTPDTSSRSRSVTPSSASHPDTPPASENPLLPVSGRNYSDFMRSLAAKYNNSNPNDYFSAARNGFPPPLDPRFKPSAFSNLLPSLSAQNKDGENNSKKNDFPVLGTFGMAGAAMFPPLIDMSTTQTLLAMVRTAKEAELQGLLKNVKRPEVSSPLDLSSAAAPPSKRPRIKVPSSGSPNSINLQSKRPESESPKLTHEDISNWGVDDVCSFVSSIDICAEYAQTFRDQRIDGSGLPMLTEDHLTTTMNMKLGPALKLRAILAKKLGSCSVCLHCTNCHNASGSPEPGNGTGNTSDSGGAS